MYLYKREDSSSLAGSCAVGGGDVVGALHHQDTTKKNVANHVLMGDVNEENRQGKHPSITRCCVGGTG